MPQTPRGVDRLAEVLEHRGAQSLRARALVVEANARAEAIAATGANASLRTILIRSANGCSRPFGPALFGP